MGHVLRDLPGSLSPQCTCIVVLCSNPGRPRACRGAVDSTPFINDRLKKKCQGNCLTVSRKVWGCLHERKGER